MFEETSISPPHGELLSQAIDRIGETKRLGLAMSSYCSIATS